MNTSKEILFVPLDSLKDVWTCATSLTESIQNDFT